MITRQLRLRKIFTQLSLPFHLFDKKYFCFLSIAKRQQTKSATMLPT